MATITRSLRDRVKPGYTHEQHLLRLANPEVAIARG
jgi:hypothetical protein